MNFWESAFSAETLILNMGIHMNVLIQYLLLFVLQYTETAPRVGILNIKIQYSRFNIQKGSTCRHPPH